MNDEQINEATEPPEPAEALSTHTLSVILQLIDQIPESELRLRSQLQNIAGMMSATGDTAADRQANWRRAVQMFGNRVYELRAQLDSIRELKSAAPELAGPRTAKMLSLPDWVTAATAIIDAYRPDDTISREDAAAMAISLKDDVEGK